MKKTQDIKEIDPYKIDKLSRVPSGLIILILKYWAAAAAVFFSIIGGPDIGLNFDDAVTDDPIAVISQSFLIVLLIALFLSLLINYVVRPIVRLLYNRRNNTFKYNMINLKGFKSFLVCLIYMFVISIILYFVVVFMGMHGLILDPFGTTGGAGIEPFSYGLYFIVVDGIFLLIKNLIIMIFQRVQYKRQIQGD